MNDPTQHPRPTRRTVIGTAGAAALATALGWTPAFRVPAAHAAALPTPPAFPAGIPLYQQAFENWSGEIHIEAAWTCAPATPADIVTIANWAHANGYRVRARGMGHNWSPLMTSDGENVDHTIFLDTTQHLTAVTVNTGTPRTVTVQTGCQMDRLMQILEDDNLGFMSIPFPGGITIGGVLAINAHGSSVPATGETRPSGMTYGSMSNTIRSLTAVVWNGSAYTLKTFQRTDPHIGAFLSHLGRALITEVTLQVGTNQNIRCQSWYSTQVGDVFAPPASAGSNSFSKLVDKYGRVEVLWFPFTTVPWIKMWSVAPSKPLLSKKVTSPYNYTFVNFVSEEQSDFVADIVNGDVIGTSTFTNSQMAVVGSGLIVTGTWDIWGKSKNTWLWVERTTLRIVETGFAVITSRANIQRVVHEFYVKYRATVEAYKAQGKYPMNMPFEIRVNGLDQPAEVDGITGAATPLLSSLRPRPDHPEWNVCVWIDMGTIPGTPESDAFYSEMEAWILANYTGTYAGVRPEWSKAWACAPGGAWTDTTRITGYKNAMNAGQPATSNYDTARTILNSYDPARTFSSTFLDTLLP
ncbi:cholesterol oxidase substrate-binding domain-containing protein [Actinocorallia longicatena]|uniref:Cholesterol oxidase substrate-binding domain-containing protein n=1 Tax=Actinocorallia longicatena TaxID=111803 RepID=A0ABP6QH20_9ACTN